MNTPQWQRWSITIPAGRHHFQDGSSMLSTSDEKFDVYVPNLYSDEMLMRSLVVRAEVGAYMEYADPPATVV